MSTLSVVIIARDEHANLPRCLNSVSWADEVIVVDTGSTDDTRELALESGAVVFELEWPGYGPAKAYGVGQATGDWVLSIDADEELSPALAEQVRAVLHSETDCRGFDMPRRTRFLGRWIYHCGWYPDRVLRLFAREHGRIDEALVHEAVIVDGKVGHLAADLLHHCYPNLEHYLDKSNRYTTLGAQKAFRLGKRANWFDIVLRPAVSFASHYFVRQGFRDGMQGFLISALSAVAVAVKYAKLRFMVKAGE